MFNSLGKRILIIYSILFAGAVLLTNIISWYYLKSRFDEEQIITLRIIKQQIINILKEAQFRYSLASLKMRLNPKEVLILEKNKALNEIRKIATKTNTHFLIKEENNIIETNTEVKNIEDFFEKINYIKFSFKPFKWKIYIGFPKNYFLEKEKKILTLYTTSLIFLIINSIFLTYFIYKRWLDKPIKKVMQSLNKGEKLEKTGIKEIDLLIDCINSAIEKEKEWLQKIAFTEKMSALGVLAGGYAHEFNNLLQIISGHIKIAQVWVKKNNPEKALDKLKRAEEATIRGSEISQRILRIARKEIPAKTKIAPIDQVVEHTLEALQKAFPKEIKFHVNCDKNLFVPLKEDELQEIILNICLNARDAMGNSGHIMIKAWKQGDKIYLMIEDTGPGIPEEIKNRLFEPFFTTKEKGKGTGLGLFVVHQLVTEVGGKIIIENSAQGGARFIIELPEENKQEIIQQKDKDTPKQDNEKRTCCSILIIDDEEEIIYNLKEFLEMEGFDVETASSAIEAYQKLKEKSNSYNLLLIDLVMPDRGGDWLIEKIAKEKIGSYKTILMTGFAGELTEKIVNLQEKGHIDRILRKPFSLIDIKQTICEIIQCKDLKQHQ